MQWLKKAKITVIYSQHVVLEDHTTYPSFAHSSHNTSRNFFDTHTHTYIYNILRIWVGDDSIWRYMRELPSKTICDLVHSNPQRSISLDVGVYCIPCKNCKLKYIGETSRNLHARIKEHKRDIRIGNLNNALLQSISQSNHNFDFNSAKMLIYINKRLRRIFEAGAISLCNSINTCPGFYKFLLTWANLY